MMSMNMTRFAMSGIVASLGLFAVTPETANAGDWSFGVGVNVPTRTVLTQPVQREWVPAVYEDREVCVEVPAVVEVREVPVYSSCGDILRYRRERVVVRSARTECRIERVLVREGYYRDVAYRRPRCGTTRSSVVVGGGVGFGVRFNKFDDRRPNRRRLTSALRRASHRSYGHRTHRGRRY